MGRPQYVDILFNIALLLWAVWMGDRMKRMTVPEIILALLAAMVLEMAINVYWPRNP
jgi:hypothetical protein